MNLTDITRRTDQLIEVGKTVVATKYDAGSYGIWEVQAGPMAGFRSAALSFIERNYSSRHPHFAQFTDMTKSTSLRDAERGVAILQAIRDEISGGWLVSVKGLVAAELYADFLEQAEHLSTQGYKDAAAVMIGSVLEEHLRQLCVKHSIDVTDTKDGKTLPRKADRLNSELTKTGVYSALDQKQITAWLGLRNNAAHGKYSEYDQQQVNLFLSGVLAFMSRVPP